MLAEFEDFEYFHLKSVKALSIEIHRMKLSRVLLRVLVLRLDLRLPVLRQDPADLFSCKIMF